MALGYLWPKLNTAFGWRSVQCLRIGIGDNEVHAFHLRSDHVGNRVSASASDPDDSNPRLQLIHMRRTDFNAHTYAPIASSKVKRTLAYLMQHLIPRNKHSRGTFREKVDK